EPERRRPRGDPCQQLQRRRDLVPAREVVLDEEGGPIPERLRLYTQLDELVEPLTRFGAGPLAARLRAAEDCELHRRALGPHGSGLLASLFQALHHLTTLPRGPRVKERGVSRKSTRRPPSARHHGGLRGFATTPSSTDSTAGSICTPGPSST